MVMETERYQKHTYCAVISNSDCYFALGRLQEVIEVHKAQVHAKSTD